MIRADLLALILDEEVTRICGVENNYLYYKSLDIMSEEEDNATFDVNIDTLARLCKQWLFDFQADQDELPTFVYIHSYNGPKSNGTTLDWVNVFTTMKCFPDTHDRSSAPRSGGKTEVEAIIKATEKVAVAQGLIDDNSGTTA